MIQNLLIQILHIHHPSSQRYFDGDLIAAVGNEIALTGGNSVGSAELSKNFLSSCFVHRSFAGGHIKAEHGCIVFVGELQSLRLLCTNVQTLQGHAFCQQGIGLLYHRDGSCQMIGISALLKEHFGGQLQLGFQLGNGFGDELGCHFPAVPSLGNAVVDHKLAGGGIKIRTGRYGSYPAFLHIGFQEIRNGSVIHGHQIPGGGGQIIYQGGKIFHGAAKTQIFPGQGIALTIDSKLKGIFGNGILQHLAGLFRAQLGYIQTAEGGLGGEFGTGPEKDGSNCNGDHRKHQHGPEKLLVFHRMNLLSVWFFWKTCRTGKRSCRLDFT